MLKVRLREYTPAGVRGRVLPAKDISVTHVLNGSPSLTFSLSTVTAGRMNAPFVVGVEYKNGSKFQLLPEHPLFVVNEDSGDDADSSKTVNFTGTGYLSWLLGKTYLHWSTTAVNGERTWVQPALSDNPSTAGYILHGMLTESQDRGWGAQVSWDFTGTQDSAGQAWGADERVKQAWRLLTPLSQVLQALVDGGLCDWTTVGLGLKLFRPGTHGLDKTEITLGGPRMTRVPVKSNADAMFTDLTVVPEKASYWLYLPNTGADTRFGRLEATMTQSGIESHDEATKLAQPTLLEGRTFKREEAFEWTPSTSLDLIPWRDFKVGDTVTARARGGKLQRRIIGITVRDDTVRAIVGSRIGTPSSKLQNRLKSVTVGGIVGGSGVGFPATVGPANTRPVKPAGLTVVSNTATWRKDGTAQSTVELSWSPVTQATDGSEIVVDRYEVWSRLPHENAARVTSVTSNTATVSSWPSGVLRLVHVVAISDKGVRSEPSLELTVTPVMPTSVVPKPPQNLTEVSNVGAFTVAGPVATVTLSWDAVTESNDDEPIEIAEYHVWVDGMPAVVVKGVTAKLQLPSGLTSEYRVLAVSNLRFASDLSTPINVTGAQPALVSRNPSAPILSTGYGNAFARWDGTYLTGGAGAHSVWAEARLDAGDPWERQGVALTGAGSTMLDIGAVGDEVFVRLVAYDQLMRETGASVVVSIVITAIDGEDILANSIESNRIKAGTIEADRLSPNVGDTLNLTANSAIVMLVDGHDTLASDIAGVGDAASAAQSAADQADAAAQNAASQAAIAAGSALVAQSQAEYASTAVEDLAAVFVVTATGAEVRSKDASNVFAISPTGAAIVQGGVDVSTWDGTKFISTQIITNSVSFGNNHIAETSGSRTVFRAL